MRYPLVRLLCGAVMISIACLATPVFAAEYVAQLSSFRSAAEARAYFNRLRARHPNLIAQYGPVVRKLAPGSHGDYYQLGVGPIGSRTAAANLCNALLAAGERDCLVRRR